MYVFSTHVQRRLNLTKKGCFTLYILPPARDPSILADPGLTPIPQSLILWMSANRLETRIYSWDTLQSLNTSKLYFAGILFIISAPICLVFTLECSGASDNSRMADSGLVVVVTVITLLLVAVFIPLISVQYEWCQVLFENNTVSEG